MDPLTIVVTAIVSAVVSAVAAYVTARFQSRQEYDRWRRELGKQYVEYRSTDPQKAETHAQVFSSGFVIVKRAEAERQKVFVPTGAALTIGRAGSNDIVLDDPKVSRQHARLISDQKSVRVHNLGSQQGVRVNGKRISTSQKIASGDVIEIGEAMITFHSSELN